MRTLTPVQLPSAPGQGSLVHALVLPDIPSPPTEWRPRGGIALLHLRLGLRFVLGTIGGSSDFVHDKQSRQSHPAVSSSYCEPPLGSSVYGLSVHFQLLSTSPHGDAVTFHYWRLAPPERDFHPLAPARSQAHLSRLQPVLARSFLTVASLSSPFRARRPTR